MIVIAAVLVPTTAAAVAVILVRALATAVAVNVAVILLDRVLVLRNVVPKNVRDLALVRRNVAIAPVRALVPAIRSMRQNYYL